MLSVAFLGHLVDLFAHFLGLKRKFLLAIEISSF